MLQNLGNTFIHVAQLFRNADLARFECTKGKKILDEALQAQTTLLHLLQDFSLLFVEGTEKLTQKQVGVAGHYRKGRFELMGGRSQSYGAAEDVLF